MDADPFDLFGGNTRGRHAEAERACRPSDTAIEAQDAELRRIVACSERAREMHRIEGTDRISTKRLPSALDDRGTDPQQRPLRGRGLEHLSPCRDLRSRELEHDLGSDESPVAFDEGEV